MSGLGYFDLLPVELFDQILDRCEHSSLKNLRGVSKVCQDAITPRVFEHFYMGLFETSLEKLISLAKSPLAKHVKRFTFLIDVLPFCSLIFGQTMRGNMILQVGMDFCDTLVSEAIRDEKVPCLPRYSLLPSPFLTIET